MKAELSQMLDNAQSLPSLPSIAIDVLRLAEDPNSSIGDIAACLKHDAALSAQLLKTANSAFYAQRRAVNSVDFALQLIGLNAAVPLIVSVSMKSLRKACESEVELKHFWRRSVLTSCLSAKLADFANGVKKEEALLAGLSQDIGILAATILFPEKYSSLTRETWLNHESLVTHEQAFYDDNHLSIGNRLLQDWNFPEAIIDAVKSSHTPPTAEQRDLAWCVSGSSLMADKLLQAIESDNLWKGVRRSLRATWLNLPEEKIMPMTIEILELVMEAQGIFDVEVLPEDIQQQLAKEKAELAKD